VKAPRAPDPYATAQAQSQLNQQTAQQTQQVNMVDQYTPYGNLTYSQTGTWGDGTPKMGAFQNLSADQQHIVDQNTQADTQMNDIALRQIGKVGGILDKPFNIDAAAGNKIADMQSQRLDPQWATRDQQLEQDLMNRGIRPGSEAYNAMRSQFAQDRNDAYNSMYINARGQAVNEAALERNQPLNEITALMNGQQLQNPNYVNTPTAQVANTDLAGLIQDKYKAKNSNYQAGMGGLFSLGAAAIGGGARLATGRGF
jgi:hypothetical protein